MEDEIDILNTKWEHLGEWLRRHKTASDVVPYVQRQLELTEWEVGALSSRPAEAKGMASGRFTSLLARDRDYTISVLPQMPEYDASLLSGSTAVTVSGTSAVYDYVARVGDIDTQATRDYSRQHASSYREIQEKHARIAEVRALIRRLNNEQTVERLQRAESSYAAAKAGVGERTAAATEMRSLIDGVKGDLFELAKKSAKENMSWETMAERLVKGTPRGIEYQEILHRKSIHGTLVGGLSDILKDRSCGSRANLEHIWTEVIDHIFTLLELVSLPGG